MVQKRRDDADHSIIWHVYPGHSVMDHYLQPVIYKLFSNMLKYICKYIFQTLSLAVTVDNVIIVSLCMVYL